MNDQENRIKSIINERQLSQWHLMIASLLGSLASQHGIFHQAFLNRIIKDSMRDFLLPYLETLTAYRDTSEAIASIAPPVEQLLRVVELIDGIFALAGQVEVVEGENHEALVIVKSAGCRFCPIGVGQATLSSDMTFCPFPTMIEQIADHMIKKHQVNLVLHREGSRTKVLTKKDGFCNITYTLE